MRDLPSGMAAIIASGDFGGEQAGVTRVTIQNAQLGLYSVHPQIFSSVPFPTVAHAAVELPNLKHVKWDRSVDAPVASCEVTLVNSAAAPLGQTPHLDDSLDLVGYYTFNRGGTSHSAGWGHTKNRWQNLVVPDRLIRVYQGYGADFDLEPENDPHMLLMGCWLVDDVDYSTEGIITLTCRDTGRLLADEIMFPPVVPFKQYPLSFSHRKTVPGTATGGITATWKRPSYTTDSNVPYVGVNGSVFGHHGTDAFDGSDSTYWLSIGNATPNRGYSFEYVQGKFSKRTINAARARVWGGPYKVYLSVKANGKWQGKAIVPYDPHNPASAPNGANIPYIAEGTVDHEGTAQFIFGDIAGATDVRFTFTDLYNSGLGTYKYRAGVRHLDIATGATKSASADSTTGNYDDYTDIVKLLLAYGGFYWPQDGKQHLTEWKEPSDHPGSTHDIDTYHFAANDPVLRLGRIWGDLQQSGTFGIADLTVDIFDKKPLLDGITYIRDILGFIFYVAEDGAAIFRAPNLFKLGNWKHDPADLTATRVTTHKTLYDDEVILQLSAKLSSRNLRERVFVGNVSGKIGAVAKGRIPNPVNFRRTGGWTDQNFATTAEAQVMADMITLRQLFTYRQDQLRIPADPSLQCDDQVEIVERITGEAYMHYVRSISSDWDAETGVWTYDITTSWLGTNPTAEWAFKTTGLSAETQAYLTAIGVI